MTKKILAIIPARGGSKGLLRKNIVDLAGKPLVAWTIEASLKSIHITKTIVSSDSEEILEIARKHGAGTIKRPDSLACDHSASEPIVLHALNELEKKNLYFDYVVLLQPTSPLRDSHDIDVAYEMLSKSKATAVISTCEINNKILKCFVGNKDGYIEGAVNNQYPFSRRQDLPRTYLPNGAIYFTNVKKFQLTEKLITNKTIMYVMGETNSIDIDSKHDIELARKFLVKAKEINK